MTKKLTSLALALVLCLSLCVPALAADSTVAGHKVSSTTLEGADSRINLYNRAWFRVARSGPIDPTTCTINYSNNVALGQITGYVYGQAHYPQYKVGNSSFANVGCEIAAVYNALKFNSRQIPIANIIRDFEQDGYLMANGSFGSDPYAIGEYLDANNVSYTEFPDNGSYANFKREVTNNISSRRTYIVSFWNGPSLFDQLHTVAFYSQNGALYVYNFNTNSTTTTTKASLADFVTNERYITGYALGERSRDIKE